MKEAARAQQIDRERLFVSFWNVCLENIPEGTFSHRRVTPDEARRLIDEARSAGTLNGVSQDLFAPYKKDEKQDHGKLCHVLGEHYGIALSLHDFVISIDEGRICRCVQPHSK